jgi:hypothetical protein
VRADLEFRGHHEHVETNSWRVRGSLARVRATGPGVCTAWCPTRCRRTTAGCDCIAAGCDGITAGCDAIIADGCDGTVTAGCDGTAATSRSAACWNVDAAG